MLRERLAQHDLDLVRGARTVDSLWKELAKWDPPSRELTDAVADALRSNLRFLRSYYTIVEFSSGEFDPEEVKECTRRKAEIETALNDSSVRIERLHELGTRVLMVS